MKNIISTLALAFSIAATAQQPQLTPQQKIDLERKAQVDAQGDATATPPVVKVVKPKVATVPQTPPNDTRGARYDTNRNASTINREVPAQRNTTNIGGAGTSGTAGNTIGSPTTTVNTTGVNNGTQVPVPTNTNPPTAVQTGVQGVNPGTNNANTTGTNGTGTRTYPGTTTQPATGTGTQSGTRR